ncbi:MAG: nitrilase-related carbon-nitrogen hydrolase [Paracoccaceae bacterium]
MPPLTAHPSTVNPLPARAVHRKLLQTHSKATQMPSNPNRVALWQGPSPAGDIDLALATLKPALMAAGHMGAAILTAPETFLPGYNRPDIAAMAQPRGGDWHKRLARLCVEAHCGLVVGYAERDGDQIFNASVAFDAEGRELAHYRKIQLYGPREKAIYTAGQSYTTFDLNGTTAALLICYDIEFAPHIAALAAQGVKLILCATANMLPFTHVSRFSVPAMAAHHALSIVYANYCGTEGDLTYSGGSVIVGPDGEPLALAGSTPALLLADLSQPDPRLLSTQAADLTR